MSNELNKATLANIRWYNTETCGRDLFEIEISLGGDSTASVLVHKREIEEQINAIVKVAKGKALRDILKTLEK